MTNRPTNFTIEQIKEAHAKVKSGADFPAFIQETGQLGIISYETYVIDGHTDYLGMNGYKISSPAKYAPLEISSTCDAKTFQADLKSHQQGLTDYQSFCRDCAKSGIEKWTVSMEKMTCTYYNKAGAVVLVEAIPE